jgi:hypothetical protein
LPPVLAAGSALLISGCSFYANRVTYAGQVTTELEQWRQYLGVAIAVQYLLLTWGLWKAHKRSRMSRVFLGLFFIPLLWTFLGEWVYRIGMWIVGWGWPGKLLAVLLSFLGGVSGGGGNVYPYLIGAAVFNDVEYLLFWSLPGVISAYVTALLLIAGKKK